MTTEATTDTSTADTQVTTTDSTAATTSTETQAKAETPAEIVYDFKAPEGMELDADRVTEFTALAKELKLPADKAQALVDMAVKAEQKRAADHVAAVQKWAEEVKADKELGGDKLAENLAVAKKALDLGPPELKGMLDSTGLGSHPAVVKWAFAVGKALSEDKFVPSNAAANGPKTLEERLYPTAKAA